MSLERLLTVAADGSSEGSFPTGLQVTLSTLKAHGVLLTLSSSSMGARKAWELLRPQRLGSVLLLTFLLALLRTHLTLLPGCRCAVHYFHQHCKSPSCDCYSQGQHRALLFALKNVSVTAQIYYCP